MLDALISNYTHFYFKRVTCFYTREHSYETLVLLASPQPSILQILAKQALYFSYCSLNSAIILSHFLNYCDLYCTSLRSYYISILSLVCYNLNLVVSEMCYFYTCYFDVEDCRQLITLHYFAIYIYIEFYNSNMLNIH